MCLVRPKTHRWPAGPCFCLGDPDPVKLTSDGRHWLTDPDTAQRTLAGHHWLADPDPVGA